jgi:hypothetical protein
MQGRKAGMAALVVVACWPVVVQAQIPGLPAPANALSPAAGAAGLGGLGGVGGAGLPAAAAAAPPKTLWSSLGLSSANLHACQAKICASQFGQMLNGMVGGPVGGLTGGFIPPVCPPAPNASQIAALQQQPGGAAAAAAQIKASEANAKARVAAVEYLGTVDCSRWPEARKALIYSLREDPNECVRFAAAKALNSGCCCNKEVIEALRVCVSGEAKGNAPPETSPRVKAAAFCALQNCLLRVPEDLPAEIPPEASPVPDPGALPVPPERSARTGLDPTHVAVNYSPPRRRPASLEEASARRTFSQTVDDARRTMFAVAASPRPAAGLPTGERSVFNAFSRARQDRAAANLRRNRQQVEAQPTAPAFVAPTQEEPGSGLVAGGVPSTPDEAREPAPAAEQPPIARRGLLGILLPSRDR